MKGKRCFSDRMFILLVVMLLMLVGLPAVSWAATYNVTTTNDVLDVSCNAVTSTYFGAQLSLREAICGANRNADADIINLQPGAVYLITIPSSGNADDNQTGDLDIGSTVTINGNGATIRLNSDAYGGTMRDRVIEVLPGASDVIINNVIIEGAYCAASDWYGGGLENQGSDTVLNNVTIRNNRCARGGGVASRANGTLVMNDCTIDGNTAFYSSGGGGLIVRDDSTITTLNRCTISNNAATPSGADGGGIKKESNGVLTLNNCTISGNTTTDDAGGIEGAGGTVYLNNCTVTNNSTGDDAGGLRGSVGTVRLRNTIVALNTAGDIRYPDIAGTLTSQGYNLIGNRGSVMFTATTGDQVGTAGFPINPLLGPLADNGGSTFTHELLTGSPAIDPAQNSCDLATDQRGMTRPQGSGCDIGAYEFGGLSINIADSVDEGDSINGTVTRADTSTVLIVTLQITQYAEDASLDPGNEATDLITLTFNINDDEEPFTLAAIPDDDFIEGTETVKLEASGGGLTAEKEVEILDNDKVFYFTPDPLDVREGDPAVTVQLCVNPTSTTDVSANLAVIDPTTPPDQLTLTPTAVTIPANTDCSGNITIEAIDDTVEEVVEAVSVRATETTFVGYSGEDLTVNVYDNDRPYLELDAPMIVNRGGGTGTVIITRGPAAHCTLATARVRLEIINDPGDPSLEITSVDSPAGGVVVNPLEAAYVDLAAGECEATFTVTGLDEVGDVDIQASEDYGAYDPVPPKTVTVQLGCENMPNTLGLRSHTFPTALFIASYDWLANFYDYNAMGRGSTDANGHWNDPDTDNFNKIIMQDSNLFPMVTAVMNDVEFPNITSRNTDRINDYINRSVAVAPNYINVTTEIPCGGNGICFMKAVGMRSHLEWVFVTDPANHNLRRYQFMKLPDQTSPSRVDYGFALRFPLYTSQAGYTQQQYGARWNDLDTFLETVPPRSYPGYADFVDALGQRVGYGFRTNTSFTTAANVRFKNPRDLDVYRDYFDVQNGGPVYVFVADTMNSRIQVFMNATGVAGDTNANFPIRPVRIKGPNDISALTAFNSNEIALRTHTSLNNPDLSTGFGDGRKGDWRQFLPHYIGGGGDRYLPMSTVGIAEFYYPHGVAVDQDPNTKDVYLFVADTFNHRIQVFRDISGVSGQPIDDKRFDFEFETSWGSYPFNTTLPGPFAYRYPKGIDVARFANNSSYLYVVDSKQYRLLKYLITEKPDGGFQSITAVAGYGYNGTGFAKNRTVNPGVALTANDTVIPGFLNPQDVTTGYSGFFRYTSVGGGGWKFLDNHMVYVTDYARNDNRDHGANWRDRLNMRMMQFIDGFGDPNLDGTWLPWATSAVTFGTLGNLQLGQSIFGDTKFGKYDSQGVSTSDYTARPGPPENAGVDGVFTERPVGIATLVWNTTEPIDMRVIDENTDTVYANGATIPRNVQLTVGTASGEFFWFPENDPASYLNYSGAVGDGQRIRRVHIFWYNTNGSYRAYALVSGPPFKFSSGNTAGFMKVVAEDVDFEYSGRTGTQIFRIP